MDKKRTIVFRADGNSEIGLGHVMRCIALSEMLQSFFYLKFAIQNPSKELQAILSKSISEVIPLPLTANYSEDATNFLSTLSKEDIVVLDGYKFDSDYQKVLKTAGFTLVSIDDIHPYHFYSDAIINHSPGIQASDYSVEPYTKMYVGSDYALLRQAFLNKNNTSRIIPSVNRVLICFGGADPLNLTVNVLEACLLLDSIEIQIVIGGVNKYLDDIQQIINKHTDRRIVLHKNISSDEMVQVMSEVDLIVCPSSTIVYEALCLDLNIITGYYVDNQKLFLDYLESNGYVCNMGDWNTVNVGDIYAKLNNFVHSYAWKEKKKFIRTSPSENIQKVFQSLSSK